MPGMNINKLRNAVIYGQIATLTEQVKTWSIYADRTGENVAEIISDINAHIAALREILTDTGGGGGSVIPPGGNIGDVLAVGATGFYWKSSEQIADDLPLASTTQKGVVTATTNTITTDVGNLGVVPAGGSVNDILAVGPTGQVWKKPDAVANDLPLASETQKGVVRATNTQIFTATGTITIPVLNNINFGDGAEHETGHTWYDNSPLYAKAFIASSERSLVASNVKDFVGTMESYKFAGRSQSGPHFYDSTKKSHLQLEGSSLYAIALDPEESGITGIAVYTKLS